MGKPPWELYDYGEKNERVYRKTQNQKPGKKGQDRVPPKHAGKWKIFGRKGTREKDRWDDI